MTSKIPNLALVLALAACKSNEASTTNADVTGDDPTSSADDDPSDDDDDSPSTDDDDDNTDDPSTDDDDDDGPSDDDDTTDPTGDSGAWPEPTPGEDVSVVAFDGQHVYCVS